MKISIRCVAILSILTLVCAMAGLLISGLVIPSRMMNGAVLPDRAIQNGVGMLQLEFQSEFGVPYRISTYTLPNGDEETVLTYSQKYRWQIINVVCREGRVTEIDVDN